jgi:hypothetical protein
MYNRIVIFEGLAFREIKWYIGSGTGNWQVHVALSDIML